MLKETGISKEKIENYLSVLAEGKASEIEQILKVLEENGISKEKIENSLGVLARGRASEIEQILKILKENNVKRENIEKNFGYLFISNEKKVKLIFDNGNQYLKRFLQAKGYYDRIITENEIEEICERKGIDIATFFSSIRGEEYQELLKETLKRKKGIYIGSSIPIGKKFLDNNGNMILDLAKKIARNFGYRYGIRDLTELESQAIEIIITKCGDIVYNYDYNPEILKRFIYSKVYKYLKGYNLNQKEFSYDFSVANGKRQITSNGGEENVNEEDLDLSLWNIGEEQEGILRTISNYIEQGFEFNEAIKKTAEFLNMELEDIITELEEIKGKNQEKHKLI